MTSEFLNPALYNEDIENGPYGWKHSIQKSLKHRILFSFCVIGPKYLGVVANRNVFLQAAVTLFQKLNAINRLVYVYMLKQCSHNMVKNTSSQL